MTTEKPNSTPRDDTFIDGFDLEALRLKQDFADSYGVKRLLTTVPIKKPGKNQFFRTHQDPKWQFQTTIMELKDVGETYILGASVQGILPELSRPVLLHSAVDRGGNPFIIPVPLPDKDGRRNAWHESLAQVVLKAQTLWVRSTANMALGAYDLHVATGIADEPKWPDIGFNEMIKIAFRGRVIGDLNHPIIQQMLGLV